MKYMITSAADGFLIWCYDYTFKPIDGTDLSKVFKIDSGLVAAYEHFCAEATDTNVRLVNGRELGHIFKLGENRVNWARTG